MFEQLTPAGPNALAAKSGTHGLLPPPMSGSSGQERTACFFGGTMNVMV